MFIASKSDTEQQIKNAERIYEEVEVYVKNKLDDSNQKERKEAFAQLEQLRKNGTVSDDEAELNAYKEEKYKQ
ncbi:MAG: UDP-N-acetylenolpyruvoylglucosamine reductase [Lachnospiraceae bacterium]